MGSLHNGSQSEIFLLRNHSHHWQGVDCYIPSQRPGDLLLHKALNSWKLGPIETNHHQLKRTKQKVGEKSMSGCAEP